MIDRTALPTISSVLAEMGISPNRHGRTKCPIHRGENRQAFSYSDEKGVWYCFRCGFGGDAIDLVKRSMDVDFIDALRFLGLQPGSIKPPDPVVIQHQRVRTGLHTWARKTAKDLRFEHYIREKVITRAQARLAVNPEDDWAWNWLQWAYTGLDSIAYKLDLLEGTEEQQIEIYRHMRTAE
jgi:hypothetical protein